MNSGNQIIYIPEYVEYGVTKLQEAKRVLEDISVEIESGISIINSSGYNRGIPYIEKGDTASAALEKMKTIISLITSEIEKYSNGEALELDSAIIIANPETAEKYGLSKEDIDYTLAEYLFKNTVSPKWDSNYLTASAGSNRYYAKDGRLAKETWCDLNPNNLVRLMKKEGIDLDFWIREDGVYMYGDYVMVAADIPHMDGSEQAAEYRKGDLVETSLGTGIVVDYCGMAEKVRKGELAGTKEGDVEVWYDIYTAWHDGGQYQHVGYCNDASCTSSHHGTSTMIEKSENPTHPSQLRNTTTQTSATVFTNSQTTTAIPNQTTTNNTQTINPVINNSSASTNFSSNINLSTNTGNSSSSGNTPITRPTTNNANTSSGNFVSGGSSTTIVPENNSTKPTIDSGSHNNVITPGTNNSNTNVIPLPETNTPIPNVNTNKDNISTEVIKPLPETNTPIPSPSVNSNNINNGNSYINPPQITTPNINYENSIPLEQPETSIPEAITPPISETDNLNQNQITPENNLYQSSTQIQTTNKNNHIQEENIIKIDNATQTKEKINPIPILAGVGIAAAAGVGVKVYADNKKKKEENYNENEEDFEQLEEI